MSVTELFRPKSVFARVMQRLREVFGAGITPKDVHDAYMPSANIGPADVSAPTKKKRITRRDLDATPVSERTDDEAYGVWFYLSDLLDQLDLAQKMVHQLRKLDTDAYKFHSKVGGTIIPETTLMRVGGLENSFVRTLPSRGLVFDIPDRKQRANLCLQLHYFCKVKQPNHVEAAKGTVYQFLFVVSDENRALTNAWCYIDVQTDGSVVPLREWGSVDVHLPPSRRASSKENAVLGGGSKRGPAITRWDFGFPYNIRYIHNMVMDEREKNGDSKLSFEEWVNLKFTAIANAYIRSDKGWQIRATKRMQTVKFNISTGRAKYFFSEREAPKTASGQKRRIFHYVEGHYRTLKDGRRSYVRGHYRGHRQFCWHGHTVTITVPGLHHPKMSEFNIAGHDVPEGVEREKDMISSDELASLLVDEGDQSGSAQNARRP